ncbi:MAG TPA: hypothetical protein VIH46_06690 [Candidatus Acidoferrales bacterium]
MNTEWTAIPPSLRVPGILLILGLAIELISLLWNKPLAFILFAFVGGAFLLAGILLYLYSLVSVRG